MEAECCTEPTGKSQMEDRQKKKPNMTFYNVFFFSSSNRKEENIDIISTKNLF